MDIPQTIMTTRAPAVLTIVSIHHGEQYAGQFYGDVDGKCDGNTYPIKQINAMVQPYKGEIHWK